MKIRSGFVSNSSSSSFLIYGTGNLEGLLTNDEVKEAKEKDEYDGVEEAINQKLTDAGAKYIYAESGPGEWGDLFDFSLGRNPTQCDDNQTMGEFKAQVEADIEKVFGEKRECDWISEAWYNG
jgi:hypothetical protein